MTLFTDPQGQCPRCRAHAERERMPLLLRLLRLRYPQASWRRCLSCGWRGVRRVDTRVRARA